jgi:hypothetical protein
MAQPTPTYTLTSSSALSDDYILTANVLVDLQSPSPVGVFNPGGQPRALFIRSDGVLCQIVPASGAGASGWSVATVGTTSGVTQVAAGVQNHQNDGSAHGFYTDSENLYHIASSGDGWSAPDVLPLCSGLGVATNSLTGELVAFGVDPAGNLLFLRENNGQWTAISLKINGSLVGTQPVLLLVDQACDWVLAVPGTAPSGGQLAIYQGSPTAVTAGPMLVPVQNPVSAVVVGFWTNNAALFLFTDDQNNLYSNTGTTANVVQLQSGPVQAAAAVVDLSNTIHLYPTDPTGLLSVLHQVGGRSAPARNGHRRSRWTPGSWRCMSTRTPRTRPPASPLMPRGRSGTAPRTPSPGPGPLPRPRCRRGHRATGSPSTEPRSRWWTRTATPLRTYRSA